MIGNVLDRKATPEANLKGSNSAVLMKLKCVVHGMRNVVGKQKTAYHLHRNASGVIQHFASAVATINSHKPVRILSNIITHLLFAISVLINTSILFNFQGTVGDGDEVCLTPRVSVKRGINRGTRKEYFEECYDSPPGETVDNLPTTAAVDYFRETIRLEEYDFSSV